MILGITGYCYDPNGVRRVAGAGKDTVADHLVAKHGFVKIGLADPLKRICKEVFDFSDEQLWGPSEYREAPDFRYPRGAQQYRDAYKREMELVSLCVESRATETADKHRRAALEYGAEGWLTPRLALQLLGTEWGRHCYGSIWIEYGLRVARQLETGLYTYTQQEGLKLADGRTKPTSNAVFSDIRFFNEFEALKKVGRTIRVRRRVPEPFPSGTDSNHQSERELSSWEDNAFDHVIDNSGDLHHLRLHTDHMYDILTGRILPYDEAQANVPPALRR